MRPAGTLGPVEAIEAEAITGASKAPTITGDLRIVELGREAA